MKKQDTKFVKVDCFNLGRKMSSDLGTTNISNDHICKYTKF